MTGAVVCLDLDRTVIYSPNALDLQMDDADAPRLLCVELYRQQPLSFMTEMAAATLVELKSAATVVPTTTRTPAQLARVHLPGPPAKYAIASNGGHLLVDGVVDEGWTTGVRSALGSCATLVEVQEHLHSRLGDSYVESVRVASDMFLYAVVRRELIPAGWLDELASWCAPKGWATSLQGRKLYVMPGPLTKTAASAEVMSRAGGDSLLAAGDSLLDADLLVAADLAIRPAHGELADTGFHAPNLTVTGARGVLAGAEILTWLTARADHSGKPEIAPGTVRVP